MGTNVSKEPTASCTPKMEAEDSSKTLVPIYREDFYLVDEFTVLCFTVTGAPFADE
jgi:hypothetical protein